MRRLFSMVARLKKQAGNCLLIAAIYALPFLAIPATATLFLKVDGIKGDVPVKGYEGWIESQSLQFGITRAVMPKGGASAPQVSEIVITKLTDVASPLLFVESLQGNPKPVDLEFVRTGPRGAERFYTLKLYDTLVSAFSQSSGGDVPTESVSLNFLKMELTYRDYVNGAPNREITTWYNLRNATGGTNAPAPNTPPTISVIGNSTTPEDAAVTIPFTINDAETPGNLFLSRSSDHLALLPPASITFGGAGANRTVTLLPATNATGTVNVTITVSDGAQTAASTFLLNVTPVNDAPTIPDIPQQSAAPGVPTTIGFAVSDPDTPAESVELFASSANTTLVPPQNMILGTAGGMRTLTITPADGQTGQTTISIRASDGALETTNSFLLTVSEQPTNQPPAFIVSDPSEIVVIAGRSAGINRLQLSDPDAGTNAVTLVMEAVNGTINVSNWSGTITSNGTASVFLSGSIGLLNMLLGDSNAVSYRAAAGMAGTDLITATLNDNGNSGSGGAHSVYTTLGIRIYASQYDQWLHQQFTTMELTNAALEATLWGFHADPDRDRLENIAEYGLGTPPRGTNHARPQAELTADAGGSQLALQFTRRQDPDLMLAVEVGATIGGPWTADATQLETVPPVDLGDGFERVRFVDRGTGTAADQRFMRMRWTLNQPFAGAPPSKRGQR
jgi:type VI protein secretion system component Hcp